MARKSKKDREVNCFEKGEHAIDLREFAKWSLTVFLKDKKHHSGENITDKELYSELSFKLVLRTQFDDDTFNFIHDNCLSRIPKQQWYKDVTVPWSVHVLLGLINELKYLQIPKDFQPGLLLLYFKLCHGFEIIPPPLL